jgi:hypothetical protein
MAPSPAPRLAAPVPVLVLHLVLGALLSAGCGGPSAAARGKPAPSPFTAADLGLADVSLRLRSAGYLVELRFRVVDAGRAAPLFEADARVRLEVASEAGERTLSAPLLAKLWPPGKPEAGRVYAIELDNVEPEPEPGQGTGPGRLAAGDRASVRFGPLLARGLTVGE